MMKQARAAILVLLALTVVCGGLYPAAVTLAARLAFARQAEGSLVRDAGGRVRGSLLIGQAFSGPGYFWPRPSATGGFPYNALASGGSNLGPTNPALFRRAAERAVALRDAGVADPIPPELLLASASGLDPHVTPAGARAQARRVAAARGLDEAEVLRLVAAHTEQRQLGFLGEPRVNVLGLNLALDALDAAQGAGR